MQFEVSAPLFQLVPLPDRPFTRFPGRVAPFDGRVGVFRYYTFVSEVAGGARPDSGGADAEEQVPLPAAGQLLPAVERGLQWPVEVDDRRVLRPISELHDPVDVHPR